MTHVLRLQEAAAERKQQPHLTAPHEHDPRHGHEEQRALHTDGKLDEAILAPQAAPEESDAPGRAGRCASRGKPPSREEERHTAP
jgi:hypothetical protein